MPPRTPCPTAQLIRVQEQGLFPVPVDHFADCGDLYGLATGSKGVPQDRNQRPYVLSTRKDRATRRIRKLYLSPTDIMLCDALTKHKLCICSMHFMTTGIWLTRQPAKKRGEQQPLPSVCAQHAGAL